MRKRKTKNPLFVIFFFLAFFVGCGTNYGKKQEKVTPEQKAQALMNKGDYQGAIDILKPLVESEPTVYARIPLLASAYAASIGVDILSILKNILTSSGSKSVFELVLEFVPDDPSGSRISTLSESLRVLRTIPSSLIGANGDAEYGVSAELQITLYQTIYTTMLLNSMVTIRSDGTFDPSSLQNITLDQAEALLKAMAQSAENVSSPNAQAIATQAESTLAAINATPGADDKEKVANYFASRNSQ